MRTNSVTKTNFQGNVYKVGKFSNKPQECCTKVDDKLQELISKKDYNLYIEQDYRNGLVNITADKDYISSEGYTNKPHGSVSITANSSKYISTAKKVIDDYETTIQQQKDEQWEKEHNKQEWKDLGELLGSLTLLPLFLIVGMLAEGVNESGKFIKNIVNKAKVIATKKG